MLQLLCLCLAITITACMAGAAAGSLSLLPEDTQSPDTNPGQRKGPPDGNMPRLHCLQVSPVSRSGRNGNIFSACNESVAPKVSWHFFVAFTPNEPKKNKKNKVAFCHLCTIILRFHWAILHCVSQLRKHTICYQSPIYTFHLCVQPLANDTHHS